MAKSTDQEECDKVTDARPSQDGHFERRFWPWWPVLILAPLLALRSPALLGAAWGNLGFVRLVQTLGTSADEVTATQSQAALQHALKWNAENAAPHRALGWLHWSQGDSEEALAAWRQAGLSTQDILNYGDALRWSRKRDKALTLYELAVANDPSDGDAWYHLGLGYADLRRWKNAQDSLQQAVTFSPENRDSWYELGRVFARRQKWELARDAFEGGLSANKGTVGQSDLQFRIGLLLQHSASPPDLTGAWAAYNKALALDDFSVERRTSVFHQRGLLLAYQEQWTEATEEFQQALALFPSHYGVHLSLADALWRSGKQDEAKATAWHATELDPLDTRAYRLLGDFYNAEGNLDQAKTMYLRVLELDPEDKGTRQALEQLGSHNP